MSNDSMRKTGNQVELKRRWNPKKLHSSLLANSFRRLGEYKKAGRVKWCGHELVFARMMSGERHLMVASFCRERLCPMCAWRRSLKIFASLSDVLMVCKAENPSLVSLFLTLTVKNVDGEELGRCIKNLFKAWSDMMRLKRVKSEVVGWFRALEITYNEELDSYHPHIHALILVPPSYFNGQHYISQKEWAGIWQTCLNVDYRPVVDVRRVRKRSNTSSAVLEVSKYAVKDADFIFAGNEALTDKVVSVLSRALKGKRLIAYAGILREIAQRLRVEDVENADLVNIRDEKLCEEVIECIEIYHWCVGLKSYQLDGDDEKGQGIK